MWRTICVRLVQMALVLWLLATTVFVVIRLAPGDPTLHLALDPSLPPAARQLQVERMGLDLPLWGQYVTYLGGLVTGDLGVSMHEYPREVTDIIAERLPRTVALVVVATVAAFALGVVVGRWTAWRRDSHADRTVTGLLVFAATAFPPWVAYLMIWVFAYELGWLPSGRFLTPEVWRDAPVTVSSVFLALGATAALVAVGAVVAALARARELATPRAVVVISVTLVAGVLGVWAMHPARHFAADLLWHAMLPTVTLTLLTLGPAALLMRSAMVTTTNTDTVLYARARGLGERLVRNRHAARLALPPVIAAFALNLAGVVTGSLVFERVFSWPGLGTTFVDAAVAGDAPLASGIIVTYGVVLVGMHLLLEGAQWALDPRLRTSRVAAS
ncbi:MAG: ABC transporter permease [Nitriliruptoraceae bacterium]